MTDEGVKTSGTRRRAQLGLSVPRCPRPGGPLHPGWAWVHSSPGAVSAPPEAAAGSGLLWPLRCGRWGQSGVWPPAQTSPGPGKACPAHAFLSRSWDPAFSLRTRGEARPCVCKALSDPRLSIFLQLGASPLRAQPEHVKALLGSGSGLAATGTSGEHTRAPRTHQNGSGGTR